MSIRRIVSRSALVLLTLSLAGWSCAQEGAGSTTPTPPGQAGVTTQSQSHDDAKTGKKTNEREDVRDNSVFSAQIANEVLNQIRNGLEGHSQRLMLSAFDGDKMDGFLAFQDQVEAYFERYEGFRVHFRIIQTTSEGAKGLVLAEFTIEAAPRAGGAPQRSSNQIRFELERGSKGWRVIDFRPRGFFS